MDQDLIARYQSGGDIYASLAATYGASAADTIAAAATSGDETQVNAAITQAKYGNPLDTSTASILASYSPSDWLNNATNYWSKQAENVGSNSLMNILKSPAVLFIGALALFLYLGGLDYLRAKLAKLK